MSQNERRSGPAERTAREPRSDDWVESDVIEYSDGGVYYATHDMRRDGLCTTIALALSEVTNVKATTLVSNFSEYADPDALNRLFRTRPGQERFPGGTVQLQIQGHRVEIDTDGRIAIAPHEDDFEPHDND